MHLSRIVQVSCSLLELCRRHVEMLQMKVLQVADIQQLVDNFLESFTISIFAQPPRCLLIAHASFLTLLVPVWQTGLAKLDALCLSVTA